MSGVMILHSKVPDYVMVKAKVGRFITWGRMIVNTLRNARPEWLALALNFTILLRYVMRGSELGRIVYWAGACLLTVGLLLMKG